MAQALHNTMARGTAVVSHHGTEVTINLPDWFRASRSLFNEEALLEHCREHGILLATLQAGFAQHLIDLRAKARPQDLPPVEKGGMPIRQEISISGAQARVDAYKPGARAQTDSPFAATIKAARKAGATDAAIKGLLMGMNLSATDAQALLDSVK